MLLPAFEQFNPGDIRIRHHYTGRPLFLHAFRHRGYWFHGRRREQSTMRFFECVLRPGDTVVEVGGHIGYVSMHFARLVEEAGRVVVFEPGENNRIYLRKNVAPLPHVQIVEAAASDQDGTAEFFEESLTGQNNSLFEDYHRFEQSRAHAYSSQRYRRRRVDTVRLDTFLPHAGIRPDLIKIDVEGAECLVLAGATQVLAEERPALMVEVTQKASEVLELLSGFGYVFFTPEGRPLATAEELAGNVCALHPSKHADRLKDWL